MNRLRVSLILFFLTIITLGSAQVITQVGKPIVRKAGEPIKTKAGVHYHFDILSPENGLSQSHTFHINEDSKGNLWFTSDDGVTRYDGESFLYLSADEGLNGHKTWETIEDNDGRLWITTPNGLCMYDGIAVHSYVDSFPPENKVRFRATLKSKDGSLWFAGLGCLYNYKNGKFTNYADIAKIRDKYILGIYQDASDNLWILGQGFVIKQDGDNYHPLNVISEESNLLTNTNAIIEYSEILQDPLGNTWIGTRGNGLFKIDLQGRITNFTTFNSAIISDHIYAMLWHDEELWIGTLLGVGITKNGESYRYITGSNGLPENKIMYLMEDQLNNVWIGTHGGGAVKYIGDMFTHFTEDDGLLSASLMPIIKDKDGMIWFGSKNGLIKYDGEYFFTYTTDHGLLNNDIIGAYCDSKNRIWIGSRTCFTIFDRKTFTSYTLETGLPHKSVATFLERKDGSFWIATYGGVFAFDFKTFKRYNKGFESLLIRDIVADDDGNLWCAAAHGLTKIIGDSVIHARNFKGTFNTEVFSVVIDSKGRIWAGSYEDGLFCFEGDEVIHFTQKRGLSNNGIVALLVDKLDNVWVSTNHGINKIFRLKKGIDEKGLYSVYRGFGIRSYDENDGFDGVEGNQNSICESPDGDIWVGTANRVTRIKPANEKINIMPPNTWIKQIRMFYKGVDWHNMADSISGISFKNLDGAYRLPQDLTLPNGQNHLSFEFVGISLRNPSKVQYQFKLVGQDDNWSPVTKRTEAVYSSLSPGSYTFMVRSANEEGKWNEAPATFQFTIRPPFWETTWFISLSISFILISMYVLFKLRTRALMQRQKALEGEVAVKTREIATERDQANRMRKQVEEKNELITDSIDYASKIQTALLSTHRIVEENTSDQFILYIPKDIVSGDFYWATKHQNFLYVTAADCTGHGVPGAMLSMLGMAFLNNISLTLPNAKPSEMLDALTVHLMDSLAQADDDSENKDGIDMSLVKIDFAKRLIEFAGANNALYLVKKGKLEDAAIIGNGRNIENGEFCLHEFNADKRPVGYDFGDNEKFTHQEILYDSGDRLYLFSDGFPDQFGGKKGKKYKYKPFKEFILAHQNMDMQGQKDAFQQEFNEWKGDIVQIDDVTIISIKL